MNQQLNFFPQPPRPTAPAPAGLPRTVEGKAWNTAAGRVSATFLIPATDLSLLREVVARYLAKAVAMREKWGLAFTPNLVVEAGEPDATGQIQATVRATHFEGWSPTPESAVWWFRSAVGVREQDAKKAQEAGQEVPRG